MLTRSRIWLAAWSAVVIMFVAAAPGWAQTPVALRIGLMRVAAAAPIVIARDKGYFKTHNITVTLRFFDAAAPLVQAAAAGKIDIGVTPISANLLAVAGTGAVTLVAGQAREQPGYPLTGYFATARAYDLGLKTPGDFAGRRIAITRIGSSQQYDLALLAERDHFALRSIHLVPLETHAAIASALDQDSVDGALLPAVMAQPLLASGAIRLLGWVGDETPWPRGAVFVSRALIRHRDVVARFLAAYRDGTRDYHDILLASIRNGRAVIDPRTKPLIAGIARYTHLTPARIATSLPYIDRDGRLDRDGVARALAWFQSQHFVASSVTMNRIVDTAFGFTE